MNSQTAFRISAVMGFLAVALGAFGAHGLKATLEATGQAANWQTAAHYHLVHAVVMLVVAALQPMRRAAWWLLFAGVLIFSGTLYVLALTNVKWLGAITPLGGAALLAGWLALVFGKATAK
jgi:uncharacterized membrane protein YgdD (TMEM256/DUF423 family)